MKYFCYERDFARRWTPVIIHGDKPSKSVNGSTPERTAIIEVSDDATMKELIAKYPAPPLDN